MDELALEFLQKNPSWTALLGTYQRLSVECKAQTTEFDGWIPRINEAVEISNEELSGIHGKLIAFGFLKFDLAGRDAGIRYQLTPFGRQALNPFAVVDVEPAPA